MRHNAIEQWARGPGPLHGMDARVKLLVTVAFLIAVSTTPSHGWVAYIGFGTIVMIALVRSELPMRRLLLRAALTLPFALCFAMISYLSNDDAGSALALIARSQLCVLATLLMVATTPLPLILAALESFWIPARMLEIAQFLYRYLFVIADQGQRMRWAAASRDAGRLTRSNRQSLLDRAGGALAVLFACAYNRAEGIHRATLSRGGGRSGFPVLTKPTLGRRDLFIAIGSLLLFIGVRIASVS